MNLELDQHLGEVGQVNDVLPLAQGGTLLNGPGGSAVAGGLAHVIHHQARRRRVDAGLVHLVLHFNQLLLLEGELLLLGVQVRGGGDHVVGGGLFHGGQRKLGLLDQRGEALLGFRIVILFIGITLAAHHLDAVVKFLNIVPSLGQVQLLLAQLHFGKELFLLQLLVPLELGLGDGHLFPGFLHLIGEVGDTAGKILTLELRVTILELLHVQNGEPHINLCVINVLLVP